ncbi:MAG: single-stranded-DNA-specific exonuclease RecJ [Gammaproteobacteria bacterium]
MNQNQPTILQRPFVSFDESSQLHPVLARVYAARNIEVLEEINTGLDSLLAPDTLTGLDVAVTRLEKALHNQERICVVGDFDADGATSTALMVTVLTATGFQKVNYLVPNRFDYGYGLTPEIVTVAAADKPDLIITVDNGISSIEGVKAANDLGISVIITDHHLPAEELPAADAIVNPNQTGNTFASKNLAGVGVAFYVMLGLRARLRETGWFSEQGITEPKLVDVLDLVALGTVADVVPLDKNNRILVQQGLARIRAGHCRPGIQALIEISKRSQQRLVATDLGFCLGPRLNAAGRLEDMSIGIECLLATDLSRARQLAVDLDSLNRERREIETGMQAEALASIDALGLDEASLPLGLCLYQPDWHQGVIGILASRIKERFHRPVIAFANNGDHELKGSARSISGLHIRDVLDAVASKQPGLLTKFGGHAMAAGLTIDADKFEAFKLAFDQQVQLQLNGRQPEHSLETDGELSAVDLELELAELLRYAGPWGQQFPEPLFDGQFRVVNSRLVGEKHLKLTVVPCDGDQSVDAIAFNQGEHHPLETGAELRLVYRLDSNEFRGICSLQLVVEYLEVLS